jgi:hypothetical protein
MFKIKVKPNDMFPYEVYFKPEDRIDSFRTEGEAKTFIYGVQYGVEKYDEIIAKLKAREFSMSPVVEDKS